jgi:hypothetical protein
MKSAKDKVLAGEKGEHVHVPASKRGKALSKSHDLYLNPDTISKDSSQTSGVYRNPSIVNPDTNPQKSKE